jgi:transposase-like protein
MAGKAVIPPEQHQRILARYAAGEGADKIAETYGVGGDAVLLVLRKCGAQANNRGGKPATPDDTRDAIIKAYVTEGLGATVIGRQYGVDKKTVYNVLAAAGVRTRPKSKAH